MSFACQKCETVITRMFPNGKFSPPGACSLHGCRSRTFAPIRSTAKAIDFQKIRHVILKLILSPVNSLGSCHVGFWYCFLFFFSRVQELLKSGNHEEGRVPRTIECELTEDLVDSCIPGDVVRVTGIINVINNYMDVGGGMAIIFSYNIIIKLG